MARKPRIHIPQGFYYVTLRGNGDNEIFLSVEDSEYFQNLIAENISKYGCRVHAFCWMRNQAHILVQTGDKPLTKFIHNISFRYTLYFNKIHNKSGHLFNGRYNAVLIDPRNYLLKFVRYIHLIPQRAGIVTKPHEYKWSSHRAYLGRADCSSWLTINHVLSLFSKNMSEAGKLYYEYINNYSDNGLFDQLQSSDRTDSRILGGESFTEEVLKYQNERSGKVSLNKIIRETCKRLNTDLDEISSQSRSRRMSKIRTIIGYMVMEHCDTTLSEYGRLVNRDVSTLSGAITNFRSILRKDKTNQRLITELKEAIGVN